MLKPTLNQVEIYLSKVIYDVCTLSCPIKKIQFNIRSDLVHQIYEKETDIFIRTIKESDITLQETLRILKEFFKIDLVPIEDHMKVIKRAGAIFSSKYENKAMDISNINLIYKKYINSLNEERDYLLSKTPAMLQFQIFKINHKPYYECINKRINILINNTLLIVKDGLVISLNQFISKFNAMSVDLSYVPEFIVQYSQHNLHLMQSREQIKEMSEQFFGENGISDRQLYLSYHNLVYSTEVVPLFAKVFKWFFDINLFIRRCNEILIKSRLKISETLCEKKRKFTKESENLSNKLKLMFEEGNFSQALINSQLSRLDECWKIYNDIVEIYVEISDIEKEIGQSDTTQDTFLETIKINLELLSRYWIVIKV